ncbi:hypothetical protein Pint_04567 [Pistacia integerrima]|uniref:Uncharacterized protein n=1 Tax=Pistacia integerrima TaxID=434235 RepID=A0ACC0Z4D1_9ROSI|nr:hypothetical protein Pint_04567 [Pistacia integerrima]
MHYHKVLYASFQQMVPPAANTRLPIRLPVAGNVTGSNPVRRRRGKKVKKTGSKRHQKVKVRFRVREISVFSHGVEVASKLQGSTPHDQLLIQTSDSFSGLLLFSIGFLLFMVAFVKDREFQSFFAKGCVLLHVSVAVWRVYFGRALEDLAHDLPRQVVGDIALALSWIFFLVYSWREKYD